jgi:hypothetical protein
MENVLLTICEKWLLIFLLLHGGSTLCELIFLVPNFRYMTGTTDSRALLIVIYILQKQQAIFFVSSSGAVVLLEFLQISYIVPGSGSTSLRIKTSG